MAIASLGHKPSMLAGLQVGVRWGEVQAQKASVTVCKCCTIGKGNDQDLTRRLTYRSRKALKSVKREKRTQTTSTSLQYSIHLYNPIYTMSIYTQAGYTHSVHVMIPRSGLFSHILPHIVNGTRNLFLHILDRLLHTSPR